MARVLAWAFEPLDMRNPAFFFTSVDSEVTGNSSSVLNLQLPSGNRQSFSGSFQYEIDPDTGEEFLIGGTIVDLAETTSQFGQLYWLSELTLSVDTWLDFLLSDDREGLNAYVFAGNDVILGSHQDDVLVGYAGNDLLDGKIGNDTIDGGLGTDTVPLRQLRSQYQVTKDNGKIVVTDLLGTYDPLCSRSATVTATR